MSLIGKFYTDSRYGPAKVLSVEGDQYKVEYFISPWNRKTVITKLGKTAPLRLFEQTRVYSEHNGRWRVGRVVMVHQRSDRGYDYDVQFPNKKVIRLSEEELYCRCWMAHDDPTATLALGGMETQYLHEHRQRFSASLLAQRSACRGLSAILSSRIEFVPHQLEVARRVLEDPMQRYLLADEVGMGKTIEAGLVIRQFLLSYSKGNVLVIVPSSLKVQWKQELDRKFLINEFPERVHICSLDEIEHIRIDDISLLVVDEVHHLVTNDIPDALQRLAVTSKRLLLLSATPSLGKADVLLRLLKLLDPDCYAEVDSDSFSTRIEKREEFGIFLRGLRADANPAILRQRLRVMPDLFSGDVEGLSLGHNVSKALAEDNKEELRRSIYALRGYVADVHRIHQRLIRTRRRDAADWVFRPRGPNVPLNGELDLGHIHLSWVEDSRYDSVFDLFEQWRVQMTVQFPTSSPYRKNLADYTVLLFEAMGCGLECFSDTLKEVSSKFLDDEWRLAFNKLLQESGGTKTRSEQIAFELKRQLDALQYNNQGKISRLAVFGSDLKDLKQCATAMQNLIGKNKVLCAWNLEIEDKDIASSFFSDNKAQVLFCSRHEEEGINLHFVEALIHLDLPFAPSRIEQRIGRLDRFGRKYGRLEQRIMFPSVNEDSSLWEAWFDLLAQAFHIFNEPIADVQFSLDIITSELSEVLLEQGASGIRNAADAVRKSLSTERDKLDNQYALDQVLQDEFSASGLFQNLDDLEADEIEIADATKGWLADSLQMLCKGNHHKVFQFRWDRNNTLLPAWPWASLLQPGLNGSHTFLRRYSLVSSLEEIPQLLRIGSSLIKAVDREYRWDDRGTAFATWRQALESGQDEWLAFKLSYIIESSLPAEISEDEKNSLRPRLDGYLPPWSEVLYVDAELNLVADPVYLNLLSQRYKGQDSIGRDFNLGSRQEALFGFIDPVSFEKLCYSIRGRSESWLREQSEFKNKVNEAYERGLQDIEHRNRRLKQRRQNQLISGELADSGLSDEIELNIKLLKTLNQPRIRLDSIGAIVLSGRSPEMFVQESL